MTENKKPFSLLGKLLKIDVAIKRFPLSFIASIIFFALGLAIVWGDSKIVDMSYRYVIVLIFLYILNISSEMWCEATQCSTKIKRLIQGGMLAFLVGYFFLLPTEYEDFFGEFSVVLRDSLLVMGFFISILVIPFLNRSNKAGNRQVHDHIYKVCLSFVVGIILSVAVFLLNMLLVGVLYTLFGLSSEEELSMSFWFFSAGIVGPLFALAALPEIGEKKEKTDLPKPINIVSKYVLIPFTLIYFVILYIYTGKIVITWQWPEDGVSLYILSFTILGWVTYFFVSAWTEKSRLFQFFTKVFPWSSLFQMIVLFVALWWRIDDYGVTVNRYAVGAMGIFFTLTSLYTVFSRKLKIVVLPTLLLVFILVGAIGPLSAINVSKMSQVNRFEELANRYNLIDEEDKPVYVGSLSSGNSSDIRSVIYYITDTYGVEFWEKEFPKIAETVYDNNPVDGCSKDNCSIWGFRSELTKIFGVDYTYPNNNSISKNNFNLRRPYDKEAENVVNVQDYDFYIRDFNCGIDCEGDKIDISYNDENYVLGSSKEKKAVILYKDGKEVDVFYYNEIVQKLFDIKLNCDLKRGDFTLNLEGNVVNIRINLTYVAGNFDDNKVTEVKSLNVDDLFVDFK